MHRRRVAAAAAALVSLAVSVLATAPSISPATVTAAGSSPSMSGSVFGSPSASEDPAGSVRVVAGDEAALAARAAALVARMTPREKAGAVVMGHLPSTDPAAVRAYMEQTGAGGFIVMGANVAGTESALRELATAAAVDPALPALVAVDQEGGDVRRLKWDDFPSSLTLKTAAPEATASAFSGRGSLVERAGIDVNFGIVADYTADLADGGVKAELDPEAAPA